MKRRRKEEGEDEDEEVKGGWRPPLTHREDGRHVMTVNAEQIGSEGKEERPGGGRWWWRRRRRGGRRQMAELARCQPYRDMTTQGNPPYSPLPFTLVAVRVDVLGDSPNCGFPFWVLFFFFWVIFWVIFCICNRLTCDARR